MLPRRASDELLERGMLATALVSGGMLMLPCFGGAALALDEHVTYWMAAADSPGTLLQRTLDYAFVPPLSDLVQRIVLTVGPRSEGAFRLPSVLGYLGAILVCYRLAGEMFDRFRGGAAALILAWHPAVVDEVRIARCYGLLLFLSGCSFWIAYRWSLNRSSLRWAIAWGCVNAALVWTHSTAITVPTVQMLTLLPLSGAGIRSRAPSLSAGIISFVLSIAPLRSFWLRTWEWSSFLDDSNLAEPFWNVLGPIWWLGLPLGVLAGMLIDRLSGVGRVVDRQSRPFRLLAVWSLLPLVAIVVVAHLDLANLAAPRYRIAFALPAACLIAGCLARGRSRAAAMIGGVLVLVASWTMADLPPWRPGRIATHNESEWAQMARMVAERGEPGEPLFVLSGLVESKLVPALYEDPIFLDYVACRLGRFYLPQSHPRYGLPLTWVSNTKDEMVDFYRRLLDRAEGPAASRPWIAASTDTDRNRNTLNQFRRIVTESGYATIEVHELPTCTLIHFQRRARQVTKAKAP